MKNTHGGGARTNANGLLFEKKTDIKTAVLENDELDLVNNLEVKRDGELLGYVFDKHDFYRFFEEYFSIDLRSFLSKKLLPDNCFYNTKQERLYIVENKYQEGAGSVDEKIQTFLFKREQYARMMIKVEESSGVNIDVDYIYVLNDWFRQDSYRDVLNYIRVNGCNYYFEELPLHKVGIY